MEYRLIHFNCARPLGSFDPGNAFAQVFLSLLPRIFADADSFTGLIWHQHGLRCADGAWRDLPQAFPYPEGWAAPDISTMAGWRSLEDLKAFSYSGRTHPPGMRRLAAEIDRTRGPGFVMWWAPRAAQFTLEDGWQRLQHLRAHGPSGFAFSLDAPREKPEAA